MARATTRAKSEYGQQLEEKQKIKREYGLRERQFKSYFAKGKYPEAIFRLLELRLDSVIYAAGFTPTRRAARQLASHGHALINGRKSTIPSQTLRPKDVVEIKETSRKKGLFEDYALRTKNYQPPSWLKVDKKKMAVEVQGVPSTKEQIEPFNFQTVIEFYSR